MLVDDEQGARAQSAGSASAAAQQQSEELARELERADEERRRLVSDVSATCTRFVSVHTLSLIHI